MFAVFVVFTCNYLGQAKFNQVRGKLIVLHTQTINFFCDRLGIDRMTRQNLIRLAHANGKRLGLIS
ncbi:electron transporter [Fischerella thermalis CCMEE 5268]|uniref:Electron transporter n=1 Tax=Fischerella thermalis CCMEE 5268 TaxID=2019662 RepID=A0A2N6KCA8_9CYAN|nr:electron transporter [Fischerella thermalis]PLZ96264.1 electron transporter [Fischerella thermalis CCMEE 5268]